MLEINLLKGPNSSALLFFQNMTQINGYKGFVGYSIRELDSNDISLYCSKNKSLSMSSPPLSQTKMNFTSDFMLRAYSSGCYYYDVNTGKWSSSGMDIVVARP